MGLCKNCHFYEQERNEIHGICQRIVSVHRTAFITPKAYISTNSHDVCLIVEPDFGCNEFQTKIERSFLPEKKPIINVLEPENPKVALTIGELELLRSDQFIACVKEVRNRTGLGLKESKDIVDQYKIVR